MALVHAGRVEASWWTDERRCTLRDWNIAAFNLRIQELRRRFPLRDMVTCRLLALAYEMLERMLT